MSGLADKLAAAPVAEAPTRPARDIPQGWTPGYEWNGQTGTITTPGLTERPTTWDDYLRDAGLDPEAVEVVEPVVVRGWDATQRKRDGDDIVNTVVRLHGYKIAVRLRSAGRANIDDLVKRVKRTKTKPRQHAGDSTLVVAIGDLQLGKMDGDGADGTLVRTVEAISLLAQRVRDVRKHTPVSAIHVAWLGDCGEGFVSQGGANMWRTTLTQTEQNRLVRKLMLLALETVAPLADRVTQVCVPGNHDEAVRVAGKGVTRYDDSHDVEAMVAVADAIALNADAYGHVQTITPHRDELTVTVETAGTIIGHAHGHKWRPGKHWDWWQGQAFSDQPIGRADVLLSAHGHHLHIEERGSRTFIMTPAMESESTWWRHSTGQTGNPGVLTFTTCAGRIDNVRVVR